MSRATTMRVNALRIAQDRKHPLFMFTVTAEQLETLAELRRVGRTASGELDGYQRGEVRQHVGAITDYLNSSRGFVLFPHALILALTKPVSFSAIESGEAAGGGDLGVLTIPMPAAGGRPAFIVDGQQRSLALARARRRDFPVPVCAFQATDLDTQREQFLRVNSTHPLPRGLISELLPHMRAPLPRKLAVRRAPAALCEALNRDPESPFFGLIRRPSSTAAVRRQSVVSDTALARVLEESFESATGALFPYRNVATDEADLVGARRLLNTYWGAVKATFPDAWGLPPRRSRLMHSVGLRAMGKLMDRAMASARLDDARVEQRLRRELGRLRPKCRWTEGTWEELGGLAWNELQAVSSHVRMLTDHLQRLYFAG